MYDAASDSKKQMVLTTSAGCAQRPMGHTKTDGVGVGALGGAGDHNGPAFERLYAVHEKTLCAERSACFANGQPAAPGD